jgi:hypothetical protein
MRYQSEREFRGAASHCTTISASPKRNVRKRFMWRSETARKLARILPRYYSVSKKWTGLVERETRVRRSVKGREKGNMTSEKSRNTGTSSAEFKQLSPSRPLKTAARSRGAARGETSAQRAASSFLAFLSSFVQIPKEYTRKCVSAASFHVLSN